ncbi:GspE/PulE family protein [Acidovorax sp. sic0104]|uniref:GspE/PulE family protein n=1 Tax=Acidovorax sp. sic0104 TaxID=2854784 RepID=UPI001C44498C|nr:GspE/PulE family protein [Acidovorax sp. sic0104]MBV7542138.1 GspE/PulE family protein [Acidovorax sp. sic0104]
MLLGELLIERGLLNRERLNAALMEQKVTGNRLGRILVRNGFLRQSVLMAVLHEVAPAALHEESVILPAIPPRILHETRSMVTADIGEQIYISTMSPQAVVRARLQDYVGTREIIFSPCNPARLTQYLQQLRTIGDHPEESPGGWDALIRRAMDVGASDIHIIPRPHSYTVMLRLQGVLHQAHEGTLEEYVSLASRIKDQARMDMAERRKPQDGGFAVEHNGRVVNLRVVCMPIVDGERIVVRLLDPDSMNFDLDNLGITGIAEWKKGISRPTGLCLICGPTGSGKTTTLNASALSMSFTQQAIYSIEDPVEYRIPYAGQVNINKAVGLDFSDGLKTFMRGDPDVIIVGEVRDIETARNAVKAAETGHLVLATLHTGSILGAVSRLRDIGVEGYELRHLLRAVMVQRLVRVVCQKCAGAGCKSCRDTGYKGRTIVSECTYLPGEKDVNQVLEGQVSWKSIVHDAVEKARSGLTNEREIRRVFGAEIDDYLEASGMAQIPQPEAACSAS